MTDRSAALEALADLADNPSRYEPGVALRLAEAASAEAGLDLEVTSPATGAFPHAPVAGVETGGGRIAVEAQLTALTGPLSPLPFAYTELAARDRRRRAGGLAAFLDMFSDRMTWLFVRAAEKYDLAALLRWHKPEKNPIRTALLALIGMQTPGLAERAPVPHDGILRHAGLLAQRTRSAAGLQLMARAELGLPVRIEQLSMRWRRIAAPEQSRLDGSAALGRGAMAGEHVPDRAGQCRIVIGPVGYADFLSLEAGQARIERLKRLVRLYLGIGIDFDIQIVLTRTDIPESRLGGGAATRLGWNGWARGEPAKDDSRDAVLGSELAG